MRTPPRPSCLCIPAGIGYHIVLECAFRWRRHARQPASGGNVAMNRSSAYISTLLCVLLVFSSIGVAFGATQEELEAARRKASDAREAAADAAELADQLKEETEALDAEIAGLQSAVDELDPDIDAADFSSRSLNAVGEGYFSAAKIKGVRKAEDGISIIATSFATPIPGAVWLLGSGLVGLVLIRKRFKN